MLTEHAQGEATVWVRFKLKERVSPCLNYAKVCCHEQRRCRLAAALCPVPSVVQRRLLQEGSLLKGKMLETVEASLLSFAESQPEVVSWCSVSRHFKNSCLFGGLKFRNCFHY